MVCIPLIKPLTNHYYCLTSNLADKISYCHFIFPVYLCKVNKNLILLQFDLNTQRHVKEFRYLRLLTLKGFVYSFSCILKSINNGRPTQKHYLKLLFSHQFNVCVLYFYTLLLLLITFILIRKFLCEILKHISKSKERKAFKEKLIILRLFNFFVLQLSIQMSK